MPDLSVELEMKSKGKLIVAGVDEAGRGPLAGPVSAAAVILPDGYTHAILDDSKKLSEKKRDLVFEDLMGDKTIRWGHAYADESEIDCLNILKATHLAMARAARALSEKDVYCLIDGLDVSDFPFSSHGIIKGDSKSLSIAAASIIAKVKRDQKMYSYAKKFPEYQFDKHKGYGTKVHLAALKKYGPCAIHRKSFGPVARYIS